jgi:hypothetical protein
MPLPRRHRAHGGYRLTQRVPAAHEQDLVERIDDRGASFDVAAGDLTEVGDDNLDTENTAAAGAGWARTHQDG